MQLATKYKGEELEEKYNEILPDVLNRLIEDRLIIQEAKKQKLTVDENRIKGRLEQMKSAYPSEKEFVDELLRNGLTVSDIEAKIRDQLLMFEMINRQVRSKIRVSPLEVTTFYREHKEEFNEPAKRQVIAISSKDMQKIKEALAKIQNGENFEEVASSLGLDLKELGQIRPGQLIKELDQEISLLKEGEVSGVVKFQDKFYIFKLIQIIPAREVALEEVKEQISDYLAEEKMQDKVAEWLEKLKAKSYIQIIEE